MSAPTAIHCENPTAAIKDPPLLHLANLSKSYAPDAYVIRDLSLNIAAGEFISVLGESGCGKSTLLKLIAGLTAPTGGSIHIAGRTPANARDLMSFVFQDPALLPWRTVARNVELALELEHIPRRGRISRVEAVLRLVGLDRAQHLRPRQLSGGMKMRVSIARALVTNPRLLLMDEPFAALDALNRNRLNEELLALHTSQQWTTLFVTHSIAEAVFLSNRIFLMSAGPGVVCDEIPVKLPTPRTAALRSDPAFLDLVGDVSRALAAIHA